MPILERTVQNRSSPQVSESSVRDECNLFFFSLFYFFNIVQLVQVPCIDPWEKLISDSTRLFIRIHSR